ncbi:hypothetical protein C9374_012667 [Naegleria lovaniensis]|uniref:Signal peptidase complex subunit 3 n=1 Tax=Naegleria lovaniensis TaxID=51637 RepID=A0AA88H055_NAELO|nr:uncharacterized protein C9374_012667 [Naegleria lovaniensis]KAG2392415.1 hypothetical protein C9374_012667 [Naegleria lovaniensis]
MYSWTSRLSSVLTDAISILGLMAICFGVSSYFLAARPQDVNVRVEVTNMFKFNKLDFRPYYNPDRASFEFKLDADLTPIFNWNVKVLFCMLYAEYSTPSHELNQVMLWDKIIERSDVLEGKADTHLIYDRLKGKYSLIDYGNELRDSNVTLKFRWNVTPYVGLSYDQEVIVGEFKLPKQYKKYHRSDYDKIVYDETFDPRMNYGALEN